MFRTADKDAELDSSTIELDQSFQRLLNEKREMTNKENNPPPNPTYAPAVPEKPLRKDLLRERLIEKMHMDSMNGSSSMSMYHAIDSSSYTFQNTFSNDEEYAAINRLMADCNIEFESTNNMFMALTRPSTIAEESTIPSDFDRISVGKASSSQSTTSTSSMASVVRVDRFPNVLRELKTEDAMNANTDDTLEEIEYVRTETGLNYVPKKKTQTISESESNNESEVILIDSSPECSFVTTRNAGNFTSAESTEYSFHTAKADFTGKSKNSELSNENTSHDELEAIIGLEAMHENRTQSTADTLCHNLSDHMESHQHQTPRQVSTASECEYSTDTLSEMPEFNNTLERIEYMMEQGQKMLKRTGAVPKSANRNSPAASSRTPTATTIGSGKKATPAKKIPFKPSPAVKTELFKRPEQRIRSPAATPCGSKIPKPKTTVATSYASKTQFRHIASPIAAYIKNTPEIPLMKTVKPTKDFFDSSYYNKMMNSHDESTTSVENYSIKSSLPRKFCNAAPQRQVHFDRIFFVIEIDAIDFVLVCYRLLTIVEL